MFAAKHKQFPINRLLFQTLPVLYALMTTKKQGLYAKVIDVYITAVESATGQKPQPEHVMSDYELAILSAMAVAFPDAKIRGCWFHYAQVYVMGTRQIIN